MEPGWRGDGAYRSGSFREAERGTGSRPGYRPGASGGWRQTRGGSGRESASRGGRIGGRLYRARCPGERFASDRRRSRGGPAPAEAPFVAGDIADRGPLERGRPPTAAETRARDARELERQKAWRDQASRAINALKAEEGTGPVNADGLERDELDEMPLGVEEGPAARPCWSRWLAAADASGAATKDDQGKRTSGAKWLSSAGSR